MQNNFLYKLQPPPYSKSYPSWVICLSCHHFLALALSNTLLRDGAYFLRCVFFLVPTVLSELQQILNWPIFFICIKNSLLSEMLSLDFNKLIKALTYFWKKSQACPAVGHKRHMPLINQIKSKHIPPSKYTPGTILNSMFLYLMKKSLIGGIEADAKTIFSYNNL